MGNFKFKQFTIEQDHSAMRVNTDGVLLGAWMTFPHAFMCENEALIAVYRRERTWIGSPFCVLDIGTGTGVIALMAAQRMAQFIRQDGLVEIDAVELDEPSWRDAKENFAASPWGGCEGNIRLKTYCCALQKIPELLPEKKYDLIFSNPPYFIDSLKSQEEARSNARHTNTLSQSELIRYALLLLKPQGVLSIILPSEEGERFLKKTQFLLNSARNKEKIEVLHPIRICKVRTTAKKAPKRYLMEFILLASSFYLPCKEENLALMENGDYTAVYKELTSPFYLNF